MEMIDPFSIFKNKEKPNARKRSLLDQIIYKGNTVKGDRFSRSKESKTNCRHKGVHFQIILYIKESQAKKITSPDLKKLMKPQAKRRSFSYL